MSAQVGSGGFRDTRVAIRYLVTDEPALAVRAERIITAVAELWLTSGTLGEIAHVLTRVYRIPRAMVVDELILLIRRPNVRLADLDTALTVQGLLRCRPSGRVSFADALLWAAARSAGAAVVYSFDQRFPVEGIVVRRDP